MKVFVRLWPVGSHDAALRGEHDARGDQILPTLVRVGFLKMLSYSWRFCNGDSIMRFYSVKRNVWYWRNEVETNT
jgi:hypothetical protein